MIFDILVEMLMIMLIRYCIVSQLSFHTIIPSIIELAKKWDADTKTPSMILFQDGKPVTRIYEQSFYLDVVAKVGKFCRAEGDEHKEIKK